MNGYTNADRERIIGSAIRRCENQKILGSISDKKLIKTLLNEMENVYIMCSPWGVAGTGELKKRIDELREKL